MGLDLSLLPFDCDYEDFAFSHTVLTCDRDYALFAQVRALPSLPVLATFTSYLCQDGFKVHYGPTTETPYGEPLTYVETTALLALTGTASRGRRAGKNTAIWAYLTCLDPQTKVALFWH